MSKKRSAGEPVGEQAVPPTKRRVTGWEQVSTLDKATLWVNTNLTILQASLMQIINGALRNFGLPNIVQRIAGATRKINIKHKGMQTKIVIWAGLFISSGNKDGHVLSAAKHVKDLIEARNALTEQQHMSIEQYWRGVGSVWLALPPRLASATQKFLHNTLGRADGQEFGQERLRLLLVPMAAELGHKLMYELSVKLQQDVTAALMPVSAATNLS
jgi:hypothetical protein